MGLGITPWLRHLCHWIPTAYRAIVGGMDRYTTTFQRQICIAASTTRVWRALCDPTEVSQWDSGVRFPMDAPPDYPQPGHRVRWRTTGSILRILLDEPQEVVPERRLRSNLSLGPARYDETYTIDAADAVLDVSSGQCLLRMTMVLTIAPTVGRRLWFRHFSASTLESMESALAAIRSHCATSDGRATP